MKRQLIIVFLSIVAFSLYICSTANASNKDERGAHHFSERSIQGTWGFSGGGTMYPPLVPEPTQFSNVGTNYFDGKGKCSVTLTANTAGNVVGPVTSDTCTYTVNPDGTGSGIATFTDPNAPPSSSILFVIVDHGRELRVIFADPIVGGFVAKRQ